MMFSLLTFKNVLVAALVTVPCTSRAPGRVAQCGVEDEEEGGEGDAARGAHRVVVVLENRLVYSRTMPAHVEY